MLNQIAQRLTECLYRHCRLDEQRRAVYIYGFELLISTMCSIICILSLSAFLPHYFSGVVFLIVFISLRLFAGGYFR